jgi:Ca2+-binding RTX toxin-like protein
MSIERVSLSDAGIEANSFSDSPSISSDGRFIAFDSLADNLVAGDTNGAIDIFVVDRQTNTIKRVSVDGMGTEGNGGSVAPSISGNGRFVAFRSEATNLVAGDTNGKRDIFVFDREFDSIERISITSFGTESDGDSQRPAISIDGRFVAFQSEATNLVSTDSDSLNDIFLVDRDLDAIEHLSVNATVLSGNGDSTLPAISDDGRFVAFESTADNLVPDDSNGRIDIFLVDRDLDSIERVSVTSSGAESDGDSRFVSLSSDGQFVAFESFAGNLVTNDANGAGDIFVVDRNTTTIKRVSLGVAGSEGNGSSFFSSLSGDGRFVTFYSDASNLVLNDTNGVQDVFVFDRNTTTTVRASISNTGSDGNGNSVRPVLSHDGNFTTFASAASGLVPGDTNGIQDLFVVSRLLTEDFPNIKLIQIGGTTRSFENYATDTYQFVLTATPLDDVTISLTADTDLTIDPAELIFTPENFDTVQTVTVTGQANSTIADRTLTINHTVNSLDTNYEIIAIEPVTVTLTDTDDRSDLPDQANIRARVLSPTTDVITALDTGSFILGKAGNDVLLGNSGQDKLYGQDGDDYLSGGDEHDYLNGNAGDDLLDGGDGFDVLYGSGGNDILNGDGGNDSLFGGRGQDELFGGAGDDTLTGGFDQDVFVLGKSRGVDTFADFDAGFDRINLIDGLQFADLTIEQGDNSNASHILDATTGTLLAILTATPNNTIAASDFF